MHLKTGNLETGFVLRHIVLWCIVARPYIFMCINEWEDVNVLEHVFACVDACVRVAYLEYTLLMGECTGWSIQLIYSAIQCNIIQYSAI